MQSTLRENDFIARLGGDEFAIILHNIGNKEAAGHLVDRIIKLMQAPFNLDGSTVCVTASIGIV
jgi:diguanylate cyclase (GGDEF)-like protein